MRLPFFTRTLGPHGEPLDASGGYYDLSDDAFLGGLAQAASPPRRLGGCWRSITCAITAPTPHEPLPGVRGHLQ